MNKPRARARQGEGARPDFQGSGQGAGRHEAARLIGHAARRSALTSGSGGARTAPGAAGSGSSSPGARRSISRAACAFIWAVTVPTLDGPLLPNQDLEDAETFAGLAAADNLVRTDKGVLASSANRLMRFDAGGASELVQEFSGEITAQAHRNRTGDDFRQARRHDNRG